MDNRGKVLKLARRYRYKNKPFAESVYLDPLPLIVILTPFFLFLISSSSNVINTLYKRCIRINVVRAKSVLCNWRGAISRLELYVSYDCWAHLSYLISSKASRIDSRNGFCNSPGEALHFDVKARRYDLLFLEISEGKNRQTYTHRMQVLSRRSSSRRCKKRGATTSRSRRSQSRQTNKQTHTQNTSIII